MTANLKRAIRVLRAYGNKVETSKGRIVAINADRVSKKSGIRSIDLERRALALSQRRFDTSAVYEGRRRESIEAESIEAGFTKKEFSFRKRKLSLQRIRRARRRYNKFAKRISGMRMSDRILEQKLSDGETADKIIADMKSNLLRSLDIARPGNIEFLKTSLDLKRKSFPKSYAWVSSHPNFVMTDTHLFDIEQTIYDDNLSIEERDARVVELLEEGNAIAKERMASVDSFYALD